MNDLAIDIINYPFDGEVGWISLDTFDLLYSTNNYEELGFILVYEFIALSGAGWIYLSKML